MEQMERKMIDELSELTDQWEEENDYGDIDFFILYDLEGHYAENPLRNLIYFMESLIFDKEECGLDPKLEVKIMELAEKIYELQEHQASYKEQYELGITIEDIKEHQKVLHDFKNGGL